MTDAKTREQILKRRAKFIATALASAGIAAGAATTSSCCPQTCLEPAIDTDAASMPCLSIAPTATPVEDAGLDAPAPRVCLGPTRTPRDG